jgi:hypothetical protein
VPVRNQLSAWVPTTVSEDSVLSVVQQWPFALCGAPKSSGVQHVISWLLGFLTSDSGFYTLFTGCTSKGSFCTLVCR